MHHDSTRALPGCSRIESDAAVRVSAKCHRGRARVEATRRCLTSEPRGRRPRRRTVEEAHWIHLAAPRRVSGGNDRQCIDDNSNRWTWIELRRRLGKPCEGHRRRHVDRELARRHRDGDSGDTVTRDVVHPEPGSSGRSSVKDERVGPCHHRDGEGSSERDRMRRDCAIGHFHEHAGRVCIRVRADGTWQSARDDRAMKNRRGACRLTRWNSEPADRTR